MLDGLLQRMSGVLKRYGVDPRELSQEQLYKLALILQLLQAQDKTGTVFQLIPVLCSDVHSINHFVPVSVME